MDGPEAHANDTDMPRLQPGGRLAQDVLAHRGHRNKGATPKLPKVVMPIVASAVTTFASRRIGMGVD